MFRFLLKLMLLFHLTNSINQFQLGANATQPELYERMSKIEATNRLQATEISVLKTNSIEDRSEIHRLRDRVDHLEASISMNKTNNDQEMLERQKRPARLLPLQLLRYIRYTFLLNVITKCRIRPCNPPFQSCTTPPYVKLSNYTKKCSKDKKTSIFYS